MRITDTSDLWWKTAVVYCLDVETFLDWNDDGVGDFEGLAHRMDYLHELGITCLWLMPFYPSPDKDDGYDIADFYGIDPRLGNHGDFVEMVRMAKDRGIRVIIDLVVNHTSDQHPWFVEARKSKDNPYRDYYVWRDKPPRVKEQPVFPDAEDSVWELDKRTGQYYLHHFYKFQPDLNVTNPKVRDEIAKIMGFWLELGVDGFRVDAVPFLIDPGGVQTMPEGSLGKPIDFLKSIRGFLGRRRGDAIMLGEANLPRPDQVEYFGGPDGDGLTMQFDFITMQNMYLSFARSDPRPLVEAVRSRPEDRDRVAVGELPAQPRRADARQADQGGAAGGVRRVRARTEDAGVRPRDHPAAADDARRRSAAHPDGVQPDVLPAGHARAVLRRGARDGRAPRGRRPHRGAHDDAVVEGQERRVLERGARQARRARGRRRLRPGPHQRVRPAPRPGLDAALHADC